MVRAREFTLLWLQLGKNDDSVLADDFRFEFPVIKMDKEVSQLHDSVCPMLYALFSSRHCRHQPNNENSSGSDIPAAAEVLEGDQDLRF